MVQRGCVSASSWDREISLRSFSALGWEFPGKALVSTRGSYGKLSARRYLFRRRVCRRLMRPAVLAKLDDVEQPAGADIC